MDLTPNQKPFYLLIAHIHHSPNLVPFFGFGMCISLLLLLAYRAIVTIVTQTVDLLETELLLFAFLCYYAHYDVVVFDLNHTDVKKIFALLRQRLIVVQLVGRAM